MLPPLIMVAPNGARRTKTDHPNLPMTLDEIVATAKNCHANGADALHLHIRDSQGLHTLDAGQYNETIAALRDAVAGMRIQFTTEAIGKFSVEDQLQCLKNTDADWASVAVREIARDPARVPYVYDLCADKGTEVQHILYDASDIQKLRDWQAYGIIPEAPQSVLLVLGRYEDGPKSDPGSIANLLKSLPEVSTWMLCAFDAAEHACLVKAAQLGGALRIGFENSIHSADGEIWPSNEASVASLISHLNDTLP